ncbi:MAG TPA: transglutaminase-like domain-containing protein [Nostocaceae cyanobacterium]|nr:transglutaminase-like domain-containing protein [Nostocaceae cyanobacterium]
MKPSLILLIASVIFWGWQTGILIFSLPIALILLGSQFLNLRWDLSKTDFKRIAYFCLISLVTLTIYLLLINRSLYFIYTLFQWLPIVFFPLIAAQIYSINENIDILTLFLKSNNLTTTDKETHFYFNFTYPYFILCIFSASASNIRDISFYLGMFVLSSLAFWFLRPKRYSSIIWLCLILIAGSIGFIGHIGLHQLHLKFETQFITLFTNANGQETDSLNKRTSIGEIGLLKQSNDIIFRVASENKQTFPLLLREATYNIYKSANWLATNPNFTLVQPDHNQTTWFLGNQLQNSSEIIIAATLSGDQSLLRLPDGTFQIDDLPVKKMEKNQYGTIKVLGDIKPVTYKIQFNPNLSLDSPPTEEDLQIANQEKSAINQIINNLDLQRKSPPEILKELDKFFQQNFTYSLQLTGKDKSITPLSTFLLKTRSGHCEYFATATTLLLRAVGIPTRYAVGYSVHEFNKLENQYVVRSRHAHAWTMVYLNGKWQAFDTTPADWTSIENAAVSPLSFISDLWSLLGFKISESLRYIIASDSLKYSLLLILPIIFIFIRRVGGKKVVRRLSKKEILTKSVDKFHAIGIDSEFYLIEKKLNDLGFFRHPSESLKNWIERLKEEVPTLNILNDLTVVIDLHYRYRFDPAGIQETDRIKLKSSIQVWLDKYGSKDD